MSPELENISEHIRELGFGMLAQAQRNLLTGTWDAITFPRIDTPIFGVLQAAQSAELLIKAAIAHKHPLLIFNKLPDSADLELLDYRTLVLKGKTVDYSALPQLLWAVTGYRINALTCYREFGNLRNSIQHFAVPDENLARRGAEFIYDVIDPILDHFWEENALSFNDTTDAEAQLLRRLNELKIEYRLPNGWERYAAEDGD
jgi:hypothetical protein